MDRGSPPSRRFRSGSWTLLAGLFLARAGALAQGEAVSDLSSLFNWDLVSLEQTNPRFNASVLSGFHSLRSPGVTPSRALKTGLGILYTQEEQVAKGTDTELFSREQVIFNPKLNYGLLGLFELGAGFEATWARGRDLEAGPGGVTETVPREEAEASAADLGIKWGFFKLGRLRLALAFDTRIAVNRGLFGALPQTLYNLEVDGDFAFTPRFGLISNLQYLSTNYLFDNDLIVFDLGTTYTFSDKFRGMVFGTLSREDEADNVLLFMGMAAQYVFEQHSFTVAIDLQLNEARRDIRTQRQIDVEFSYTFTF
jgi:hypothetical protein